MRSSLLARLPVVVAVAVTRVVVLLFHLTDGETTAQGQIQAKDHLKESQTSGTSRRLRACALRTRGGVR